MCFMCPQSHNPFPPMTVLYYHVHCTRSHLHVGSFLLPVLLHLLKVGMVLVDYLLLLIVVTLVVHLPVPEPHLLEHMMKTSLLSTKQTSIL